MYQKKIKIQSFDVDATSCIRYSSLMKYFQQIAREDLDTLGLTYDYLRSQDIVFVLCKYTIGSVSKICADKTYTFKTYPCCTQGVCFIRDFCVCDENDNILCEATTSWVIINVSERKILRPSKLPIPIPEDGKINALSSFRTNVRGEKTFDHETIVRYSQLDQNEHLNNCCYADIIFDGFYSRCDISRIPAKFMISYESEAQMNDKLYIEYYKEQDCYIIKGINNTKNNTCFIVEIDFS